MKKIVWLTVLAALVVSAALAPMAVASAETAETEKAVDNALRMEENETFADYFVRVWLDKMAQYACVLLGAASAVAMTVAKVKKAHKALTEDSERLQVSQKELARTQAELAETKEVFTEAAADLAEALDKVLAAEETLREAYGEAYGKLDDIARAVTVGFCNDKDLIKSGYAKEIARILGVNDENGES